MTSSITSPFARPSAIIDSFISSAFSTCSFVACVPSSTPDKVSSVIYYRKVNSQQRISNTSSKSCPVSWTRDTYNPASTRTLIHKTFIMIRFPTFRSTPASSTPSAQDSLREILRKASDAQYSPEEKKQRTGSVSSWTSTARSSQSSTTSSSKTSGLLSPR